MGTYSSPVPEDRRSSSRQLLSRLTRPFRTVKGSSEDFHIRPDEPHRTYSAGDHVHGAVVVVVTKPIRITHLVVVLHGFVRVYKVPPADSDKLPQSGTHLPLKGYTPLFQDEQVLSGEGRLEAGRYEFKFDLVFPGKMTLPSSINFDQGTIAYNIAATLTRPTTISATTRCERSLSLIEKVDVGLVSPPRPRTIFLEPISKMTRRKKSSRGDRHRAMREPSVEPSSDVDSVGRSIPSEAAAPSQGQRSVALSNAEQVADARSVFSGDSNFSGSTGASLTPVDVLSQISNPAVKRSTSLARLQAVDTKTITTTIELLKGGCLPGDTIPVRVTVQHTKRIKSMHGVIVTLYRYGRINPTARQSINSDASGMGIRSTVRNDSKSRSKTRVFRKDLCQTVAPLIIDPTSLCTTVSVSVKVPEDSFPTIGHVPGDMISFKYHLEVIVDLGGRLEGQFQGSGSGPQTRFGTFAADGSATEGGNTFMSWSTNVVNTEHLRREKGVIYDGMEVIVGTLDSTRLRGKTSSRRTLYHPNASSTSQEEAFPPWRRDLPGHVSINGDHHPSPRLPSSSYATSQPPLFEELPSPSLSHPHSSTPLHHLHATTTPLARVSTSSSAPAPAYIPPPYRPDVNNLSEKERMRWQEQRLLPSQPPQNPSEAGPSAPGPSETGHLASALSPPSIPSAPSAPSAPLEEDVYDANDTPSAPPAHSPVEPDGPSAPTLDDVEAPPLPPSVPDKLEVERQRLLDEASAPPEFPEDAQASGSGGRADQGGGEEPSAPAMSEEDEYGAHYAHGTAGEGSGGASSEPLPRYEK